MPRGGSIRQLAWLTLAAAAVLGVQQAAADHKTHVYKDGEVVALFANKVGPFHNPR
jgi:hypothetical protein